MFLTFSFPGYPGVASSPPLPFTVPSMSYSGDLRSFNPDGLIWVDLSAVFSSCLQAMPATYFSSYFFVPPGDEKSLLSGTLRQVPRGRWMYEGESTPASGFALPSDSQPDSPDQTGTPQWPHRFVVFSPENSY